MEIHYTIILFNKFKHPYFYTNDDEQCIQTDSQVYETTSKKIALQIAKDFLDVPEAEMSLDEVRKQFESTSFDKVPESKLVAIQNYYNGRLALFKHVKELIENFETKHSRICQRFDIPYEYNHFVSYSEDDASKEEQLEAYIEVDIDAHDPNQELIDNL